MRERELKGDLGNNIDRKRTQRQQMSTNKKGQTNEKKDGNKVSEIKRNNKKEREGSKVFSCINSYL